MILIAQDGTYYAGICRAIVEEFKFQVRTDDGWTTIAEYADAEEFYYVLGCLKVKLGFQNRFKFPERDFYEEYRTNPKE